MRRTLVLTCVVVLGLIGMFLTGDAAAVQGCKLWKGSWPFKVLVCECTGPCQDCKNCVCCTNEAKGIEFCGCTDENPCA
jgi:hypothetical protein